MNRKKIRVAELFAGVGGFRLGLEKSNYDIVWSNQWEPTTKKQHAAEIYANIWSLKQSDDDDKVFLGKDEIFVNKNIIDIDNKLSLLLNIPSIFLRFIDKIVFIIISCIIVFLLCNIVVSPSTLCFGFVFDILSCIFSVVFDFI